MFGRDTSLIPLDEYEYAVGIRKAARAAILLGYSRIQSACSFLRDGFYYVIIGIRLLAGLRGSAAGADGTNQHVGRDAEALVQPADHRQ